MNLGLKNHEFILHYQPKVDSSGELIGLEALIRWQNPSRGLINPDQFLSYAEQSGLILSIDCYVIQEACRQMRRWRQESCINVPVAINISPFSLENCDLQSKINASLQTFGLSSDCLEIEIIESRLIENTAESITKLQTLRELGIKIAIDDFGTGYSCLSKLRDYPLDILKIDKSFLHGLKNNSKSEIILEAIFLMSRGLNLEVVVEGVENEEQFSILKGIGCSHYQGYLFGKPMNAGTLERKYCRQCNIV